MRTTDRTRAALVLATAGVAAALAWASSGLSGREAAIGLVYAKATNLTGAGWVWRARTDGSHAVRLAPGRSPQLSPDGRWIAFVRSSQSPPKSDLSLMPAGGGPARLLQRVEGEFLEAPVWAPDSRHLVSVDGGGPVKHGGLALIDSVSGREKVFARGRRLSGVVSPSFSPDSRQIVYGRYDQTGGDLYVYNAASGKTKQITRDHKDFDPSWGPRWIAFNRSGSIRGGDVWLIRPDGTGAHRLTHTNAGTYPAAWSANGRRLLAANPATHNGRLWGVEVSSGRAHDLTGWVGDLFPQGLSRDGTTILAAIGCGGLASPYGVVETLPFAGGKPRVIVKGPCRASWNR